MHPEGGVSPGCGGSSACLVGESRTFPPNLEACILPGFLDTPYPEQNSWLTGASAR